MSRLLPRLLLVLPVSLGLALGLGACGDKDEADDLDEDGDGYVGSEDCDDDDPAVNPEADERCNGVDDDCDGEIDEADAIGTSTFYADTDGDGWGDPDQPTQACSEPPNFADNAEDCDDRNADISPSATELCSTVGIDDDCDGSTDDPDAVGATTVYTDADGDGYGDPSTSSAACEPGEGTVDNGDDCDDADPGISPLAVEECNGVDDDCDGEIDEPDAIDASTWYADADADTYGDPESTTEACSQPEGYVADDQDCDDSSASVNPGADELCATEGVDDDCDGEIDEASATDVTWWYRDADSDSYGTSSTKTKQCEQPTGYVDNDDDCDDSDDSVHPGATELCNGVDDDCDSSTTEEDVATFTDTSGTHTDYSSTLSGTKSSPASVTLSDDGTLTLCEGTYYVNLEVEADVDILGFTGDPADVILDGASTSSVLDMYTDGIEVSLTDLTVQNGAGTSAYYGTGTEAGGGLACYSSTVTALLSLDNVVVQDNDAAYGGGIWAYDCEVEITDSEITSNTAELAAGITMFSGELSMEETEVTSNDSTDDAGGILIWDISGNGVDASFKNITVSDNTASDIGGGMVVLDTTVDMAGDTSRTGIGFTDNDDAYGGIVISDNGGISFTDVDFGTSSSGDDNDPVDIYNGSSGFSYWYDDDETVTCDEESCGTQTVEGLGGSTYSTSAETGARGNVFIAESNGTVETVYWYLYTDSGSGCDVDFYMLSANSTSSSSWTVEWSTSTTLTNTAPAYYAGGSMGVPVVVGKVYAMVYGWDCSSYNDELYYAYDQSGSSTSDVGLGTTKGRWIETTGYSTHSGTASSGFYSQSFRYLSVVYWSH